MRSPRERVYHKQGGGPSQHLVPGRRKRSLRGGGGGEGGEKKNSVKLKDPKESCFRDSVNCWEREEVKANLASWMLRLADLEVCGPDGSRLCNEGIHSGLGMPVSEDLYFCSCSYHPCQEELLAIHPRRKGNTAAPLFIGQLANPRRHLCISGLVIK